MNVLELKNIYKKYSEKIILNNINLNVKEGEFLTLLGPSGCGKTTTLRIIAGLEAVNKGIVQINGKDVTGIEANKRNVNTVFQNYALFPHMNVFQNIAYSLKIKRDDKKKVSEKVFKMLKLIKLEGYENRKIGSLSGGEKQRVAIARALVNEPEILLLDEPLGALDLKLRKYMQSELKTLQKKLNITFIYVTHDQEEALNMSDRIAVMNKGEIEQISSPQEVYNNPKTKFVASFVGERNIFEAPLKKEKNFTYIEIQRKKIAVNIQDTLMKDKRVYCSILFDKITISNKNDMDFFIEGKIIEKNYMGSQILYLVKISEYDNFFIKIVNYNNNEELKENDLAYISWNIDDLIVFEN